MKRISFLISQNLHFHLHKHSTLGEIYFPYENHEVLCALIPLLDVEDRDQVERTGWSLGRLKN